MVDTAAVYRVLRCWREGCWFYFSEDGSPASQGTTKGDPPQEHAPWCWVTDFVSCLDTAGVPRRETPPDPPLEHAPWCWIADIFIYLFLIRSLLSLRNAMLWRQSSMRPYKRQCHPVYRHVQLTLSRVRLGQSFKTVGYGCASCWGDVGPEV